MLKIVPKPYGSHFANSHPTIPCPPWFNTLSSLAARSIYCNLELVSLESRNEIRVSGYHVKSGLQGGNPCLCESYRLANGIRGVPKNSCVAFREIHELNSSDGDKMSYGEFLLCSKMVSWEIVPSPISQRETASQLVRLVSHCI